MKELHHHKNDRGHGRRHRQSNQKRSRHHFAPRRPSLQIWRSKA